jgi:serine protease Do
MRVSFGEVGMIDYDKITECVALVSTGIISSYTYPRSDAAFGSGFFIDSQLMVTCKHVIKDANKLYFRTKQLSSVAFVEVYHEVSDLALLRFLALNSKSYLDISFEPVNVGEEVYAVGFPLGVIVDKNGLPAPTVTKGIISRLGVKLELGKINVELIQFDAAVNPGNSGGPLLNSDGKVIGVVNSGIPSAQNIGFAVPSVYIKTLIEDYSRIASHGYLRKEGEENLIGCVILEARTAKKFGINVNQRVALINNLEKELASKGLEIGDIILEVNGKEPSEYKQILDVLLHGGKIKIYRKGKVDILYIK